MWWHQNIWNFYNSGDFNGNKPSPVPLFTTSGEGLCWEREPKESKLSETRGKMLLKCCFAGNLHNLKSESEIPLTNFRCMCWQTSLTCLRSCHVCVAAVRGTRSSLSPSSHNRCLERHASVDSRLLLHSPTHIRDHKMKQRPEQAPLRRKRFLILDHN